MRILLVDDEVRARLHLADLIAELQLMSPDLELIGEADNGIAALEAIERLRPDLVLLDVRMPGLNGFEVVEDLGPDRPAIVFVTGYDEYAVQAFEVGAVDFLLKPVEIDRLRRAIEKARHELLSREQIGHIKRLLAVAHRQQYLQRVIARKSNLRCPIPVESVYAFVADHELVYALTTEDRHTINLSLRELEQRLDPKQFIRIHRQVIVNLDFVKEVERNEGGNGTLRLANGKTFSISRRYGPRLQAKLKS
ncbi:MAG: response regulator [Blastocatellales bacterium]|nr:response regulator [Blastocatellales bacterium]